MTPVEIVNWAFGVMGVEPITSFTEDTEPAKLANRIYEITVKALLSKADWNFATKRVSLNKLATNDNNNYSYAYQLPSDFLKVVNVRDTNNNQIVYEIQADKLYSNTDGIYLSYIYYAAGDSGNFSMPFIDTLKYKLALDMCIPLTGKTELVKYFAAMYETTLKQAKALDAQQAGIKRAVWNSDWINARGIY